MAKPKVPPEQTTEEGQEFPAQVRLRQRFKDKLFRVAKDLGRPMGDVIEAQMKTWVNGEYKRVIAKEQNQADEE